MPRNAIVCPGESPAHHYCGRNRRPHDSKLHNQILSSVEEFITPRFSFLRAGSRLPCLIIRNSLHKFFVIALYGGARENIIAASRQERHHDRTSNEQDALTPPRLYRIYSHAEL
jgi:hypothetical protein